MDLFSPDNPRCLFHWRPRSGLPAGSAFRTWYCSPQRWARICTEDGKADESMSRDQGQAKMVASTRTSLGIPVNPPSAVSAGPLTGHHGWREGARLLLRQRWCPMESPKVTPMGRRGRRESGMTKRGGASPLLVELGRCCWQEGYRGDGMSMAL